MSSDLRKRAAKVGLTLPNHPGQAANTLRDMIGVDREFTSAATNDLNRAQTRLGRTIKSSSYEDPEVQRVLRDNASLASQFGKSRARIKRTAGTTGGSDIMGATPRFYDPLEFWDVSGLPWNVADEGHRHKLHKWMRLYYATHHLVPILVDIFTRFPLVGMELKSKDDHLVGYYEDVFFDQLNYGEFLVQLGREYWLTGEAYPLGSWDNMLGVWEREELLNPEHVIVENFPLLGTQQVKITAPDYLKKLAQEKRPAKEYALLEENFGDLIPYLRNGEHIPISNVLLKQVANKLNSWDDHGTPILLRGLRTLLHEEKLLASQDAVAERLYSPLLLAKLGIQDMGDGQVPWIPEMDDLENVRDDLDVALNSDFRLMVHHFGLDIQSVFGRESMPRLGDDFDRIERRIMQVFGVNPSLLSAGSNSQPYASSALQAEFMNQILRTFQNMLKKHYHSRAMVVAEAQEHHDYVVRGGKRIPVFETVVKIDEETGKRYLVEVPKLLVPELSFSTLDLRDEATERQFLQTMRQMGVPIPDSDLMVGIPFDLEEMTAKYNREIMEKTIAQQKAKMDAYTALEAMRLPVPSELLAEVQSVLQPGAPIMPQAYGPGAAEATGGPAGAGAAPGGGIVMPAPPEGLGPDASSMPPGGGPPPATPMSAGPAGTVPDVSNERRQGLQYNASRPQSDLADFMADHHLGLDFQLYVAEDGPGVDAPREELEDALAGYRLKKDSKSDRLNESYDEPLKNNQEFKTSSRPDGQEGEWVHEDRSVKRFVESKTALYSIVDPEDDQVLSED